MKTWTIGVWSVSVEPDASAVTVSGDDPDWGDTDSAATGGASGPGIGVGIGALVAVAAAVGANEGVEPAPDRRGVLAGWALAPPAVNGSVCGWAAGCAEAVG